MPLSEDEERILQDIERTFYEQDPKFARSVETSHQSRAPKVPKKVAIATFVLGVVIVVTTFTSIPVVAFLGFILMMASAGIFVNAIVREKESGKAKLSAIFTDRLSEMRNDKDS